MGHVTDKPVLVVTGTLREAAALDKNNVEVIAAGSDQIGLVRKLEERAPYVAGLVSSGMCGAIDHTLKLGAWVIGRRVSGAFHGKCDPAWVEALRLKLPKARVGSVHADGHMLSECFDKHSRAWASAALVADMESHIVAEAAARFELPFVVLRCVSDGAEDQLPPAVEVMMRPDGGVDVGAVVKSVRAEPGQIPLLAHTLYGFAKAYKELQNGTKLLGDRLAFDQRIV